MSDRSLFLAAVLLGLVATLPALSRAKGQWCNDEHVTYEASMTLESATVGGAPVAVPQGETFGLRTTVFSGLTARVFCASCDPPVMTLEHLSKR